MEELTLEFKLQNATEEQVKEMERLQATIENDADFVAANSLEEAYVAVKKYIKMTLEQFKEAYEHVKEKVAGLFEEVQSKRALSDEELDIVAGGGFGSWFKKNWKKAVIGAGLAVAAIGLAVGTIGSAGVGVAIAGVGCLIGGGGAMAVSISKILNK